MNKLLSLVTIITLSLLIASSVYSASPTSSPKPTLSPTPINFQEKSGENDNIKISLNPTEIDFKGREKGGQFSNEVLLDLSELPPTAEILDASLSFYQNGIDSGIAKVLDKRSITILDSFALGQKGKRVLANINTLVQEWVKNPDKNMGFIFQTSELDSTTEIKLFDLALDVEYFIPDKTNPEILKLELNIVDPSIIGLAWETDEPVVIFAEYGKTSNYDRISEKSTEYKQKGNLNINDLSPELTYHIRLVVKDLSGNTTKSEDLVFTTNNQPHNNFIPTEKGILAPRLLNLELRSTSSGYVVDLAWSKTKTDNIMGYIVFRNLKDGNYSELTRLDKSTSRYTDTKVVPGNTYNYYVISYAGTQQSGKSPIKTASVPSSGVLGLDSVLTERRPELAIFFISSGLIILLGITYFFRKKLKANIAYNEKLNRHQRLHNYLHDPSYYINGYEDSVIEEVENN